MKLIQKLDSHLINKIAAGEVVERPLSVVKELTENAVDAGASVITVEIRDGGLTQIRVTDNGSGIPAEQAALAFDRHATSKIANADDLFRIATMGFRGEALASIAAVSQTEMITKTAGEILGTRIVIHGGETVALQEVGSADGTTVIVSNLFYNTPARRKFIKKPAAEAGYIADVMHKLALGNPGLSFRYISDGKLLLQTNGNGDLKTAVNYVWGREISAKLIPVRAEADGLTLDGYIGKPEIARGNRQYGLFYVNGRTVQSRLLQRAAEDAAKPMLFGGKFPVYVLRLTVGFESVDVNVHPAKTEVRFEDEAGVYRFVHENLKKALAEESLIPEVRLGRAGKREPAEDRYRNVALWETENTADTVIRPGLANPVYNPYIGAARPAQPLSGLYPPEEMSFRAGNDPPHGLNDSRHPNDNGNGSVKNYYNAPPHYNNKFDTPVVYNESSGPFKQASAFESAELFAPASAFETVNSFQSSSAPARLFSDYVIHGLLFQTYWLVEQGDSLFLIDQHAAHERVLYEEIWEEVRNGIIHSQPLLEPMGLSLTPRETQLLNDNREVFERFGFETRETDGGLPMVTAVPFIFKGPLPAVFFTEILDKMEETTAAGFHPAEHKAAVIAMAACKAAVKANDRLSEAEARALLIRLLEMENPYTCPHGRPTVIEITRRELERKFKRVV